MITRQMTPFSHLLVELYLLVYFSSIFQDLKNSVPWGPPFPLCFVPWNTHLCAKDDTFKPADTDMYFLQTIY